MKQPKNSLQLPKSIADTRRIEQINDRGFWRKKRAFCASYHVSDTHLGVYSCAYISSIGNISGALSIASGKPLLLLVLFAREWFLSC